MNMNNDDNDNEHLYDALQRPQRLTKQQAKIIGKNEAYIHTTNSNVFLVTV